MQSKPVLQCYVMCAWWWTSLLVCRFMWTFLLWRPGYRQNSSMPWGPSWCIWNNSLLYFIISCHSATIILHQLRNCIIYCCHLLYNYVLCECVLCCYTSCYIYVWQIVCTVAVLINFIAITPIINFDNIFASMTKFSLIALVLCGTSHMEYHFFSPQPLHYKKLMYWYALYQYIMHHISNNCRGWGKNCIPWVVKNGIELIDPADNGILWFK